MRNRENKRDSSAIKMRKTCGSMAHLNRHHGAISCGGEDQARGPYEL